MAGLDDVLAWLSESESDMIALLETLVNIDSGSYDKAGVDAVGEAIAAFLQHHDIDVTRTPIETHGDAFRADVAAAAGGNRPIMLLGHRDTVFPAGEAGRRPFKIEGGRAYGPGVADMKAGLVMNAFTLAAFRKFKCAPAPLVGLFTGDEEIGSPTSRPIIEATAREAAMVFNSEPGRASGNIVSGRKGGVFFAAAVEGVAAHSGGQFEKGRSAIEELARKIQAWHALTDLDAGVTVNVGLISGGQSVNTVAPLAEAQIDLRYVSPEQRDRAVSQIDNIAKTCSVDGTSGAITIKGEFAPLAQTADSQALIDSYLAAAKATGLDISSEFTGGCADSGFTAGVGTPTVCAVGPVGGNAHTPEEYLEVASFVPRAQTLARTIMSRSQ
ncbi:MAG: M20 family metallopeptidase [Pseudomonadota bacterium]